MKLPTLPPAVRGELETWRDALRRDLLEDTLPFWFERCPDFVDPVHGGFLTFRDHDGRLLDDDKGVWQQGRASWFLAHLCNTLEARDEWHEAARSGVEFLVGHGFDPADGRMWFHLARDGTPIRKRRYAYSESFAAIAFAEWARRTGSDEYAARSHECLRRFVDHHPAPKTTAHRPAVSLGPPMIALFTAQCLREALGWQEASATIDACIRDVERLFVKDDLRAVLEIATPEGGVIEHADGRTLNPGHALEAAWFLLEEARHRGGDESLVDLAIRIADYSFERGLDPEHGGILSFVDLRGGPVQEYWHEMKFWWPQNEAFLAALHAFEHTGEERHLARARAVRAWSLRHHRDPEHGEWFGYLRRDGSVASTFKGNLWKGLFHLPRMQLFGLRCVERVLARP